MAMYGRCRVSDVNHIHEIHDASGHSGFTEMTTKHRKAARSVQQKALLMPIVISGCGLSEVGWIHVWVMNRKEVGLPTSGALINAPAVGDHTSWLQRPLTSSEITNIIPGFFGLSRPGLDIAQPKSNYTDLVSQG